MSDELDNGLFGRLDHACQRREEYSVGQPAIFLVAEPWCSLHFACCLAQQRVCLMDALIVQA